MCVEIEVGRLRVKGKTMMVLKGSSSTLGLASLPNVDLHIRTLLLTSTYDHTSSIIVDPVRSRILKPRRGGLVLRWVTTGEYPLLYVLFCSSNVRQEKRIRRRGPWLPIGTRRRAADSHHFCYSLTGAARLYSNLRLSCGSRAG